MKTEAVKYGVCYPLGPSGTFMAHASDCGGPYDDLEEAIRQFILYQHRLITSQAFGGEALLECFEQAEVMRFVLNTEPGKVSIGGSKWFASYSGYPLTEEELAKADEICTKEYIEQLDKEIINITSAYPFYAIDFDESMARKYKKLLKKHGMEVRLT